MSIFGRTLAQSTNTFDIPVYEGHVAPSLTGVEEINLEATTQAYAIESALYIADVVIEQSVMENAANADVLMESVVKDSFEKIKKAVKDFWAKIKAWFDQVKKFITAMFLSGKKLVEKYQKELSVNKKGFSYKGYHWTLDKGNAEVTAYSDKIDKFITDTTGQAIDKIDTATNLHDDAKKNASKEDVDTSNDSERLLQVVGGERKEFIELLQKAFRNGHDSKDEFEDFNGNSKAELIEIVKTGKTTISDVKKNEKRVNESFTRVLKTIQRAETAANAAKADGAEETKRQAQVVAHISRFYSVAKEGMALMNAATGVQVSMVKAAVSSSTSVLRSYITYKPKKEGFEGEDFEGSDSSSLLENALRML